MKIYYSCGVFFSLILFDIKCHPVEEVKVVIRSCGSFCKSDEGPGLHCGCCSFGLMCTCDAND